MIEEGLLVTPLPEPADADHRRSEHIVSIVLTAENHLGSTAFALQPRKREERQQRLRRAFQQAADFAVGQGVDLFIQAGDLFDSATPHERDRSFVAARLALLRQAGIRTFALGGVHDTPFKGRSVADGEAQAPQVSYARLGALHYFAPLAAASELEPVLLKVRDLHVGICGLGVLAGQEGDPLAGRRVPLEIERADIAILILHAPLEGLSTGSSLLETRALVRRSSIEQQTDFRYILAGYHHRFQHLRRGRCDVIVAGATQHIDFGGRESGASEAAAGSNEPGFVFLGLAADGIRWCEHIPVDAPGLQQLVVSTSELWSDSAGPDTAATTPTDAILERLQPLCDEEAMLQLRLVGQLTLAQYHQLDLNQIRRYGEERCFALAIDDSGLAIQPGEKGEGPAQDAGGHGSPVERLSPRDELLTILDEWLAASHDEHEKKALSATREELMIAMEERDTQR